MSKEIEKMTAIYEKHKNTMYAVALKILKNPQDAEDAVHNTIPPIMRNLDAIKDVDSKDCIYYVTMAVKHMSFNMIRDRHIQTVSLSDIEYEFASDESIAESVIIISSLAMFLIMFLTSLYGLWKIKNGDIIADVRNDFV